MQRQLRLLLLLLLLPLLLLHWRRGRRSRQGMVPQLCRDSLSQLACALPAGHGLQRGIQRAKHADAGAAGGEGRGVGWRQQLQALPIAESLSKACT